MSTTNALRHTVIIPRVAPIRRHRKVFPCQSNVFTIIGPFYEQPMDADRYQQVKMVERARELFACWKC